MLLNATFNNIQLYRGGQFCMWMKPKYPETTTDLPQVTNKLSHNFVTSTSRHFDFINK